MKSESPVVSFIIPTFNEEKDIERTLLTIKNQDQTIPHEIIVVDGQSTDRTVEIAKRFAKVLISPRRGKTFQVNHAASQAKGEILIFIDADTYLPDNYLREVYRLFQKKKDLYACGAPFFYDGGPFRSFWLFLFTFLSVTNPLAYPIMVLLSIWANHLRKKKHPPLFNNYYMITINMHLWYNMRNLLGFTELAGCNMCVKKEIFQEIGGFKQVPGSKGIDAMFSQEIREIIKKHGKGKFILLRNVLVFTNPRFITADRMKQRLAQAKKLSEFVKEQKKR
ncbi:MAG: glycosyltransferase [Candidatus Helarchaeota archaeon]